jgi:glycosyltransferase involved in cell wall biosynthesis
MPDVTVVIPTYNRKEYLRQAIASCFDGNEDVDVEVVVVDDGSTDDTRAFLEELDDHRVRSIFQGDQGGQVARNRGLVEANGTYVKFLDDDDWLKEGALKSEYNALEENDADVSYGTYDFVKSDGTILRRQEATPVDDPLSALLTPTLLTHPLRFTYRKSLLDNVQWDPTLPCRQDVDFIISVATKDPDFARVGRTVGCFRCHHGERVSLNAGKNEEIDAERIHALILVSAIEQMQHSGLLNHSRKRAAAQGLWRQAHILAAYDLSLFRELYRKIQQLHPGFSPHRNHSALSFIDSLIGPKGTEHMTHPFRRAKQILRG